MNLICGINPVLEALSAGTRHFDRLLVVKGLRNRRISDAMARAGRLGIPLRFEARDTLDRMAGGIPHQGLIAVVSAKPVITLEKLVEQAHEPGLLVVLDGVEDPRNLGAIVRTVEAAGGDGVLLPERHSAGLSETVSRASAGALEHVRVAAIGNVVQALGTLKERGYWVVGFDAAGTDRWDAVDFRRPVVLVLGGEGRGMRRLVREHCDHLVSIPLFGHVTSLNVSVAAGIALYEAVRQRGVVPSHVRPIPARPAGAPQIVGPAVDDGEHDPGAHPRHAEHVSEYDEDDAPGASEVAFNADEEDAAWSGPQVLPPAGPARDSRGDRHHGRRERGRGRGHDGRPGREVREGRERPRDHARGPEDPGGTREAEGAEGAPPTTGGEGPHAPPPPGAPRGPRRRRRRHGPRPGPGPRPEGAPGGETGGGAGPRNESGGEAGGPGDPPGAPGRHRRRRRRRR